MIFGIGFASLDEREDAGEMKKPDALDAARFTDGHGADETFCRPFVEFRACAAGIKFMAAFWRTHPHGQIAFPVADKLCGAGLCRMLAIFSHARAGRWHDAQKIFPFTIHATKTLTRSTAGADVSHTLSNYGRWVHAGNESVHFICPVRSRTAQTGARSIHRPPAFTRLQTA